MTLDLMTYEPVGDKKNSDFFNEYRLKIYERRKASGLEELLGAMCAVVVQVEQVLAAEGRRRRQIVRDDEAADVLARLVRPAVAAEHDQGLARPLEQRAQP